MGVSTTIARLVSSKKLWTTQRDQLSLKMSIAASSWYKHRMAIHLCISVFEIDNGYKFFSMDFEQGQSYSFSR